MVGGHWKGFGGERLGDKEEGEQEAGEIGMVGGEAVPGWRAEAVLAAVLRGPVESRALARGAEREAHGDQAERVVW
jgi:hypothetical protein